MNKNVLLIAGAILFISVIFAVNIANNMYGGETKTLYVYNQSESCVNVSVQINSGQQIELTKGGVREYSLEGCNFISNSSLFSDMWACDCIDGQFNLTMSTLKNTINSYTYNISFFN